MNSLIVIFAIIGCAVAQFRGGASGGGGPAPNAAILRQDSDINPDGSYQWSYETDNGISAQENGSPKVQGPEGAAVAAQGSFQYTAPDGQPISITYTADENGFVPQGAHLPVAPEIPPAIARALEWIAAHPEPQDGGRAPAPGGRRF